MACTTLTDVVIWERPWRFLNICSKMSSFNFYFFFLKKKSKKTSPVLNFKYFRNFLLYFLHPRPNFLIPSFEPNFLHNLFTLSRTVVPLTTLPLRLAVLHHILAHLGRALHKFSSKELMSLVQQLQFSCSIKNANSLFYFECIPDPKSIWNNVFSVHIAWIYLQNTMQSMFCW